jgi:ABC-type multidrug transport system permease subunit
MNFFSQLSLQFRRQFAIKKRDKLATVIVFVIPIILGLMSGMVFLTDDGSGEYAFWENYQYSEFSFMLIITSIFLGLLISVVEIIKERHILEKEKMFGVSTVAYYFAKFFALIIFSLIQNLLLYSTASYVLEVPPTLFLENVLILYVVSINSVAIGLLISSFAKNLLIAYNLIAIIVLPQLLFGGGFIPFESMSHKLKFFDEPKSARMPFIGKMLPAAWAYEDMMVSNYVTTKAWKKNVALEYFEVKRKPLDDYMSKDKSVNIGGFKVNIATSIYNKLVLAMESFALILITLGVLRQSHLAYFDLIISINKTGRMSRSANNENIIKITE